MLEFFASAVVALAGLYLLALGLSTFLAPGVSRRFLLGFAGSASAHYLEMSLRLVVAGALVVRSDGMLFGNAFFAFGWVIVITTGVLLLVPWRWHRGFAQRTVPPLLRHLRLFGVVAIALAVLILGALLLGPGATAA